MLSGKAFRRSLESVAADRNKYVLTSKFQCCEITSNRSFPPFPLSCNCRCKIRALEEGGLLSAGYLLCDPSSRQVKPFTMSRSSSIVCLRIPKFVDSHIPYLDDRVCIERGEHIGVSLFSPRVQKVPDQQNTQEKFHTTNVHPHSPRFWPF